MLQQMGAIEIMPKTTGEKTTVEKPASAADIVSIVGQLDSDAIASILAIGASETEVLEAYTWLAADDEIGTETGRSRSGRVGLVYEILAEVLEPPDDRERP